MRQMPVSLHRLRVWFVALAIVTVAVVAGFYFYARIQGRRFLGQIPQKLGVDIQQSSEGFSLSKSEGGHTLFTIRAAKAIQYAQGGLADLRDVNIVVYGRQSNRFDQIYGPDFEYDPKTGMVTAHGEVHIDLEGNAAGPVTPDQAPPKELQNPIHVVTNGLVFNQKTGIAHSDGRVEFSVPQESGSAVGATYDTKQNTLKLDSRVQMQAKDPQHTALHAERGSITKDPRRIDLAGVAIRQSGRDLQAEELVMFLTPQNEIERGVATGNVQLRTAGTHGGTLHSPRAEMTVGPKNQLQTAVFTGGVRMEGSGANAAGATAGRMELIFGDKNEARTVHATEGVRIQQPPAGNGVNRQAMELVSQAVDLYIKDGQVVTLAETPGPAQVTITPVAPPVAGERTVVTAARMRATFDGDNHLEQAYGEPDAKVTSITPGAPNKVSTSNSLVAHFAPGGEILDIVQSGNFRYTEAQLKASQFGPGPRLGFADRARYTPADDALTLTGSPRIVDGGLTITANTLRIDRATGDAFAQGAVKTSFSQLKENPGGAILATSDPVHTTSSNMNVQRQSGIARYTGNARLWQGANVVEAPTIEFNQATRSLVAQGVAAKPVTSVFVQVNADGKTTPVVVTASRLVYNDSDRTARYSGGVMAKTEGNTLTADHADVLLDPAESKAALPSPSRLNRITALGHVLVQQLDRRATGEMLVYTAADEKSVLTGGPPLLADSEHGTIRGDSLTFYTRDDRVLVESKGSSRTITRTHVAR